MPPTNAKTSQRPLVLLLLVLLGCGFLATSLASYHAALQSIRDNIVNTELPLTSDNVYSEIQKDLVRPILISSMMSRDTYVRDWVMAGEQDIEQMTRYLREVQEHYATVTSFFVSDKTHTYYQAKGVLKQVQEGESRDLWYFRVRDMQTPYEINVDVDMANQDRLTVFINYKVFDYAQRFIGATGVGLTVDAVVKLIDDYQQRYDRSVYFVDTTGRIVLTGATGGPMGAKVGQSLSEVAGLEDLMAKLPKPQSGNFEYQEHGRGHFLNVRFIPELDWYLFVDKHETGALAGIRQSLYINLLICLLVTAIVLSLVSIALRRYQTRITALATTDALTELPNRRGFDLLANQAIQEARREQSQLCALLLDLDNFKELNDTHGHLGGDEVLRGFARNLQSNLRQSDIICRWGGEEFILLLKNTPPEQARQLAEKIRQQTEHSRFAYSGASLHITTSIGLAELHADDTLNQLLARADRALYRAKQAGRNRLCEETA
ncbi:sensor domain-containing diguanylate cyclase [Pseudomonas sp. UBA2684]|uniref:sensor domain-containing diguanylate cyclase n=1 Tax=Pseudomonas sp. UBA2684 TaxID=1947311 RepID=UPI000E9DCB4A|nr:sensor domain-containing diguanylate cyclase [Pseudomonas sp. UBA2684]HBX55517.1 GGDEF domain-containing protein [Pseudomonas sp.]|tara:strand:+ start:2698 stop:4170 length:1473 start_codon:yes stop_codon:yes gene_type:complete